MQNGAPAFLAVVGAFLLFHVVVPSLKQLWRLPAKAKLDLPPPTAVALLIGLGLFGGAMTGRSADSSAALPESVTQQIRIEDKFALATAKIHWQAEKGQVLPLLF